MPLAAAIVSLLLASALTYSALRKLSHQPEVVQTYVRVGVPEERLNYLAVILLAGAAGLIAGLFWAPIGIAAAAALVVYFLLAVGAHIGARDTQHAPTPIAIELICAAVLALRLATL
jgi:DoxX-like protein